MAVVLIPLPDRDFDVTEVAVPWSMLTAEGHQVVFATEAGARPAADPLLLSGVVFGQLGAAADARDRYAAMIETEAFRQPLRWADVQPADFDGLLLPGGHAGGMRQYLGSDALQRFVAQSWLLNRPVGAICHGVLVLARARHPETGRPLLASMRTTCLPRHMERAAFLATAWRRGRYYRTYPRYVEHEVRAALDNPAAQFERGPIGLRRGTADDDRSTFVVVDGRYVSARWPGDAYRFARLFASLLPPPVGTGAPGGAGP